MRITVMNQISCGLPQNEFSQEIEKNLERVKWYLWHGNVFMALQVVDDIIFDLETLDDENPVLSNLLKHVSEFNTYIAQNRAFIPNYGDRYYYGETISTASVESTVNQVVSKRSERSAVDEIHRGKHSASSLAPGLKWSRFRVCKSSSSASTSYYPRRHRRVKHSRGSVRGVLA